MSWLAALLLIVGLALVGSDGLWFPWINLVGLVVLCGFYALMKCFFQEVSSEDQNI